MAARPHIYDGKAKTIFAGPDDSHLIQYFKDDATAFNAAKHDIIVGKGILNNIISEHIMRVVATAGIQTHFVERLNDREQLIRKVDIIPLEVVVRNIAAGSIVKRLAGDHIAIKEGDALPHPLIEYYLKEDALEDPIIGGEHVTMFGLASPDELAEINRMTLAVNTILQGIFTNIGIKLIDFKLEFGRLPSTRQIILADEISPDNCRLWDAITGVKKDKDRFRQDLGGFIEAYADIANRLGLDTSGLNVTGAKQ
ncbi:MAG: phosphoribosylaminoimidazolesuccinocarboxamide synthase [Candidatus Puniceispirillales bacterium WSBS_2018_MAG_OTU23]